MERKELVDVGLNAFPNPLRFRENRPPGVVAGGPQVFGGISNRRVKGAIDVPLNPRAVASTTTRVF